MRKFRALSLLCLTLLFGGAAAGQTVTSTYDKDYGLSRLSTYRFVAAEREKSDPLASNTLTEQKIKDALDEELQDSGRHTPPDGADPDFLVAFHAKAEEKVDERGAGPGYVRGTLIVDFYDAATKRLVWRGVATGAVGRETIDLKLAEEESKRAAKMLLWQFGQDVMGF